MVVVGLGYVGLPLAETFAWGGYPVLGFDIDATKVAEAATAAKATSATSAPSASRSWSARGRFDATSRSGSFRRGRRHHHLRADAADRSARARPVVHRPHRPKRSAPFLRPASSSSWKAPPIPARPRTCCGRSSRRAACKAGDDFFLAYSPEREDPGNRDFATRNIPKVVGGLDETSRRSGRGPVHAGRRGRRAGVRARSVAEACKILENTYRAVNIALVNELKVRLRPRWASTSGR